VAGRRVFEQNRGGPRSRAPTARSAVASSRGRSARTRRAAPTGGLGRLMPLAAATRTSSCFRARASDFGRSDSRSRRSRCRRAATGFACGVLIFEGYELTETTLATHVDAGPCPTSATWDAASVRRAAHRGGRRSSCAGHDRRAGTGETRPRPARCSPTTGGSTRSARSNARGAVHRRPQKDVIVTSTGRAVLRRRGVVTRPIPLHAVVYGDRRTPVPRRGRAALA
jgi:hypothetical protein